MFTCQLHHDMHRNKVKCDLMREGEREKRETDRLKAFLNYHCVTHSVMQCLHCFPAKPLIPIRGKNTT